MAKRNSQSVQSTVQFSISPPGNGIHPRKVNILIGMAADYLEISHGAARQLFRSDRLTIKLVDLNNDNYFDVSYDGMCIILLLEDNL